MGDLLIRGLSDEQLQALSELARAAGSPDRQSYVRDELARLAAGPVVKTRYAIKVYGVQGEGVIRRYGDGPVGGGCKNFSQEEIDAYKRAQFYVERNQPGDREQAIAVLVRAFQEVSEVAM